MIHTNQPSSFPLMSAMNNAALHNSDHGRHDFVIQSLDCFVNNRCTPDRAQPTTGPYTIIWVKNGSGRFITALQEYTVHHQQIFCFGPGQLRHIAVETGFEGYAISLSADFFYRAGTGIPFSFFSIEKGSTVRPLQIQLDEDTQGDAEEILTRMHKEFNTYLSLRLEILQGLFKIFLLYLSRKSIAKDDAIKYTRDECVVKQFMCLLNKHIETKKMVADYARALQLTPSYLNHVVKKVSGFTASHHIHQQIVLETKRRVMDSNCSMKEIAYGLGFDDLAHFSKFFKHNTGISFTNFKKGIVMY
jgi:AraC-like DNA-binding protein